MADGNGGGGGAGGGQFPPTWWYVKGNRPAIFTNEDDFQCRKIEPSLLQWFGHGFFTLENQCLASGCDHDVAEFSKHVFSVVRIRVDQVNRHHRRAFMIRSARRHLPSRCQMPANGKVTFTTTPAHSNISNSSQDGTAQTPGACFLFPEQSTFCKIIFKTKPKSKVEPCHNGRKTFLMTRYVENEGDVHLAVRFWSADVSKMIVPELFFPASIFSGDESKEGGRKRTFGASY